MNKCSISGFDQRYRPAETYSTRQAIDSVSKAYEVVEREKVKKKRDVVLVN